MKLSSIMFFAFTLLLSSNLLGQSSFNDLSMVNFSTENHKVVTPKNSNIKTSSFSIAQIRNQFSKTFRYPASMKAYNIEGASNVSFTLTKNGSIEDVVILESLGSEFDYEIRRVLSTISNIPPITLNGEAIPHKVIFPIHFEL